MQFEKRNTQRNSTIHSVRALDNSCLKQKRRKRARKRQGHIHIHNRLLRNRQQGKIALVLKVCRDKLEMAVLGVLVCFVQTLLNLYFPVEFREKCKLQVETISKYYRLKHA